tara:strand:- start:5979 stop:6341 length:363 start_codon:yes stop_codon:yes gene_type:complete
MFGKRSKKKGSMQKFLEKKGAIGKGKNRGGMSSMFRSRSPRQKTMAAPQAQPQPQSGGLLRNALTITPAIAAPGGAGAIGMNVGKALSPFGNPLAPKPVPGLRREMERHRRRVPQRYGAK